MDEISATPRLGERGGGTCDGVTRKDHKHLAFEITLFYFEVLRFVKQYRQFGVLLFVGKGWPSMLACLHSKLRAKKKPGNWAAGCDLGFRGQCKTESKAPASSLALVERRKLDSSHKAVLIISDVLSVAFPVPADGMRFPQHILGGWMPLAS
jgi:hypothetical protein